MNLAFREFCQRAGSARNRSARKPCEARGLSVKTDSTWPEQVAVDEWLNYKTVTRGTGGRVQYHLYNQGEQRSYLVRIGKTRQPNYFSLETINEPSATLYFEILSAGGVNSEESELHTGQNKNIPDREGNFKRVTYRPEQYFDLFARVSLESDDISWLFYDLVHVNMLHTAPLRLSYI